MIGGKREARHARDACARGLAQRSSAGTGGGGACRRDAYLSASGPPLYTMVSSRQTDWTASGRSRRAEK